MTRHVTTLCAALAGLAGCGSTQGSGSPDAGTGQDGGGFCSVRIAFLPADPVAPTVITAYADLDAGGLGGLHDVSGWQVYFGDDPVEVVVSPGGDEVTFTAAEPGVYRAVAHGSVGGMECITGSETVSVRAPGANEVTYRLRLSPAPGQPAPAQDRLVTVSGGADADLGTLSLDGGLAVVGQLLDGVEPLAAYLRLSPTAPGAVPVETFAGADGALSLRLLAGAYEVLVVPEGDARAPIRLTEQVASSSVTWQVPEGAALSGVVEDGEGAPVVGARVSVHVGGVPSTLAITDAGGAFTVRVRAPGVAAVSVVPAAASGLPRLELPASAGLAVDGESALTIKYAASTPRQVSPAVVGADGASPAAGARTVWIARPIAAAGTVAADGGPALTAEGRARVAVTADAGGQTAPALLPPAVYDLVVEPGEGAGTDDAVALVEIDLSGGDAAPATVSLAAPAVLSGSAVDGAAVPLAGVRVSARPTGVLAASATASASTTTDAAGAFRLAVAGGGSYELSFESTVAKVSRVRLEEPAPAAGAERDLGAVVLPPALRLSGKLAIPGVAGGASGVAVTLLCFGCDGVEAEVPVAATVSKPGGGFSLMVPDPGVGPGP